MALAWLEAAQPDAAVVPPAEQPVAAGALPVRPGARRAPAAVEPQAVGDAPGRAAALDAERPAVAARQAVAASLVPAREAEAQPAALA